MAPDRRFGLPHPLDADPSEDSSPRKPGLWESFKRAIRNPPPEASSPNDRPDPPLRATAPPAAPRSHSSSPLPADVVPDPPGSTAGRPRLPEIDSDVPFLVDDPGEPIPEVLPGPELATERTAPAEKTAPETAPVRLEDSSPVPREEPSEPAIGAPKLARGLASFSRRNAEREKKFAHLIRDREPTGSKSRPRGKRG